MQLNGVKISKESLKKLDLPIIFVDDEVYIKIKEIAKRHEVSVETLIETVMTKMNDLKM